MSQGGDHAWGLMQTAPNSMRPDSVGMAKIRRDDPGLQTVAGGQYSYRPRTPTRPTTSTTPHLHLRKTSTYAEDPRSYIVMTRRASPRQKRMRQQVRGGNLQRMQQMQQNVQSEQQAAQEAQEQMEWQKENPQNTAGHRISIEHYINVMRDSVHRLGHAADPIIDQLCFTSRRAQLDALFRLCPSVDFIEAGKVASYLAAHENEIEHLRVLARGNSAIPADHLKEPSSLSKVQKSHVAKKHAMRNRSALPDSMTAPNSSGIDPSTQLTGTKGVNSNLMGPNMKSNSARYRQEEAHARTHAPVLEYGIRANIKVKTNVQTIFEDLEKQNFKVLVVGKSSFFCLFFFVCFFLYMPHTCKI